MDSGNWCCEYCQSTSEKLQTQADFVKHLYSAHLTTEKIRGTGNKFFRCKYGPDGVCKERGKEGTPTNGLSGMDTYGGDLLENDQEYQSHVVRCHLYHPGRRKREIGVSSVTIPHSALTYQEIRGDRSQASRSQTNLSDARYTNSHHHQLHSQTPSGGPSVRPSWTVYHSQVNLAAVLNDPKHRQTDIFSRTWGDSFERAEVSPSPYLPPITSRQFERYLSRVVSRSKASSAAQSSAPRPPGSSSGGQGSYESLQSQAELETIPKLFFQSGFNLESPTTFNTVLLPPNEGTVTASTNPFTTSSKSTAIYQPLHNRLSHYLDMVEIHIARQISRKSGSFFEAVSSHDTVREKLDQTLSQVQNIRQTMKSLNQEVVTNHMKILRLARQKRNYEALHEKLKLVMTVHAAQPTIQTLLATSDFCGALDLIATTQELVQHELAGLHCFRHLDAQLTEMARFVDKMVQAEFIQVVQHHLDYRHHSSTVVDVETLEDDQLTPCLMGMIRINRLHFVDIYHSEANQRIKDTVKSAVVKAVCHFPNRITSPSSGSSVGPSRPDSATRGNGGGSTESPVTSKTGSINPTLAEQMRQLDYPEWMTLLEEICTGLAALLLRIRLGCELMLNAVNRCASGTTDIGVSQEPAKRLTGELHRLSTELVNTAQERLVKVLNARAKDGFLERLAPVQFVALSRTLDTFQTSLGDGGNSYPLLRSTLQSLAVRLVTRFHEERRTKLTLILDNERWKATEVPAEFQSLANYIRKEKRLGLPPTPGESILSSSNGMLLGLQHASGGGEPLMQMLPAPSTTTVPAPVLVLSERKFMVAGTVLLLFKMILEYCQCADDVRAATRDVLLRMVELLKLFNSRTCQLVLGAGAIQLLGMKTISTRNLALASSCLQLVLALMPQVRHHFGDLLSPPPAQDTRNGSTRTFSSASSQHQQVCPLKHLDQVEKLYRDHVSEISSQLVLIMDRNAAGILGGWRVRPPVPSQEIRTVCTQLTRLHEAIEAVLPPDQITELFLRVHNKFKAHLRERLREQRVNNDSGPQHGLVMSELAYYMTRLRTLSGLGQFQEDFGDLWHQASSTSGNTKGSGDTTCSAPTPNTQSNGGSQSNQNIATDST